jgi:hypothetical protein
LFPSSVVYFQGPIHGLELEQALTQTRDALSSLPIAHVKLTLESAIGKGYVPTAGGGGGGDKKGSFVSD